VKNSKNFSVRKIALGASSTLLATLIAANGTGVVHASENHNSNQSTSQKNMGHEIKNTQNKATNNNNIFANEELRKTTLALVSAAEHTSYKYDEQFNAPPENIEDERGLTAGLIGFTTNGDDMKHFIDEYNKINPNNHMKDYTKAIYNVSGTEKTDGLEGADKAWKDAAKNDRDNMIKAQKRVIAHDYMEDFGRDNATKILKKYEPEMATFNDDVQGTGIVVLAGILGGLNIAKKSLTHQRILIYGAGTAGMGIANILLNEMKEQGLNDKEAKNLFYFVDKQGLLNCYTPNLSDEQKEFINDSTNVQNTSFKSLEEIVSEVQPTILIGTSTQPGAFNEQVVKTMSTYTERPIILPLSNPTKLAEAKAEDLLRWTNGKALIGTGIPVENIQYNGVEYQIGQANNALMYPGLGLGLIASKAQRVNKDILSQASHALGNLVDVDKPGAPILPPISKIESFSQKIAEDVAQAVIDQKLNGSISTYNVKDLVAHYKWQPIYESLLDK